MIFLNLFVFTCFLYNLCFCKSKTTSHFNHIFTASEKKNVLNDLLAESPFNTINLSSDEFEDLILLGPRNFYTFVMFVGDKYLCPKCRFFLFSLFMTCFIRELYRITETIGHSIYATAIKNDFPIHTFLFSISVTVSANPGLIRSLSKVVFVRILKYVYISSV
jgi:hypothetical protein